MKEVVSTYTKYRVGKVQLDSWSDSTLARLSIPSGAEGKDGAYVSIKRETAVALVEVLNEALLEWPPEKG